MNFDVTVNGKPWRVAIELVAAQGQVQVTIKGRRRSYDVSWVDHTTLSLIPLDGDTRVREFSIHAKGGGTELLPWLRELAKKDEAFYEDDASLALWALGDDSAAAAVATQLENMVSAWASPNNMDPAVEILDIAARRRVAAEKPFRAIVDAAAQIGSTGGAHPGTDYNLRALNLAAAHAFLKSSATK